jgi:nicotinate-nucleotide pyrophosphorylase (carboxylating)
MLTPTVERLVDLALEEDLGRGDLTTEACIDPAAGGGARLVARQDLVACGADLAVYVFRRVAALDGEEALAALQCGGAPADGALLAAGATFLDVRGRARTLLMAERTALNFLGRLCGIATLAARWRRALDEGAPEAAARVRVADTRKTTPGWRVLEKRAVRAGGLHNHRMDLGSGLLIKDNHIAAAGGVAGAVRRARAAPVTPHTVRVQVEVESAAQLDEALAAGADALLLDNRSPAELAELVGRARARAAARGAPVVLEASGGISLDTLAAYARTGVDVLSAGALTRGAVSADLALDWTT